MTAMAHALRRSLIAVAGVGACIALWWLVSELGLFDDYIIPPPGDVWSTLTGEFDMLMDNLGPTAYESILGFAVGNLVAILVAISFVFNRAIERSLFPVAVFVQTLPLVALAPVLVLMFGSGATSKIIIAAIIVVFPTLVNMTRGLQAISDQTVELFQVMSASKRELFWKARTYASLPFLFSSLKIASTTAVIGAVIAEWVGSDKGLGFLIINATYNFNAPLLYATMIVTSLFALALFAIVSLLERRIVTWEVAR
jgi:NitT/TauT family transport system permease protein